MKLAGFLLLSPTVFHKFERVLRAPHLLVECRLEAPLDEQVAKVKGDVAEMNKVGTYRSIFIEKIWSLDEVTGRMHAITVGAEGHPGENPRFATRDLADTG